MAACAALLVLIFILNQTGERTHAEESHSSGRWIRRFDNGAAHCGSGTGRRGADRYSGRPPAGKALDMVESTPITGSDAHVTGISTASGDYKETANSDVVVITAGFPRKPGMSRDDLLKANYDVIKAVVEQVVKYSPNAILIMVTNPLDAMVQAALQGQRLLEESRDGHGRRSGLGAHERLRGHGAGRLGRKREFVRARRSRRRHGAAAALLHRRRNSPARPAACRIASRPSWIARARAAPKS